MIDKDPSKRPNATECLKYWNREIFPKIFSRFLFHIGASFQRFNYLYSDNKISLIRYHINTI